MRISQGEKRLVAQINPEACLGEVLIPWGTSVCLLLKSETFGLHSSAVRENFGKEEMLNSGTNYQKNSGISVSRGLTRQQKSVIVAVSEQGTGPRAPQHFLSPCTLDRCLPRATIAKEQSGTPCDISEPINAQKILAGEENKCSPTACPDYL